MEKCMCCGAIVFESEISVRAVQLKESFSAEVTCFECRAMLNQVEEIALTINPMVFESTMADLRTNYNGRIA